MKKSIFRLYKRNLREPTAENDLWADLLKNFDLPADTEYVNFLLLLEAEEKEIAKQIEQIIENA